MTWHAQAGKLVLAGTEAKLFREALLAMSAAIVEAADDETFCFERAAVFDRMGRSQQLASLEVVARYLLHPTNECLPLTAWSEATLATVLHEVKGLVQREDNGDRLDEYRETIAAALELGAEIEDWDDPGEWEDVLDCYEERFLWDLDFEDEAAMDLSPEQASHNQLMMGIGDEYYSAIPPDLGAEDSLQYGAERVRAAVDGG